MKWAAAFALAVRMLATAYCPCPACTGWRTPHPTTSGMWPEAGVTIACPRSMLGEWVLLDGEVRRCDDTGSAINGRHVDVFVQTHAEAVAYGVKRVEVRRWKN